MDSWENLVTACLDCNRGKRDALLSPDHEAQFAAKVAPAPAVRPGRPRKRVYQPMPTFDVPIGYVPEPVDEPELCECGEPLEDGDEEICITCYEQFNVFCWRCGIKEQTSDSWYCVVCLPRAKQFVGGIQV